MWAHGQSEIKLKDCEESADGEMRIKHARLAFRIYSTDGTHPRNISTYEKTKNKTR